MTQTILVTGASSGIGFELAKLFSRDGSDVILVARDQARLDAAAADMPGQTTTIVADLSVPSAPQTLFDKLAGLDRRVDVLVNNAGFGTVGPLADQPLANQLEMVQVNIASVVALTRLFLPDMLRRKSGGILNVASTAGFQPGPYMSVYYATKAFVLSFSQAIAEEAANDNVTVTALCPGPTDTHFQARAGVTYSPLFNSRFIKVMSAADVARVGYEAFRQNRRVIIPGITNRLAAFSTRLTPRRLSAKLAGKLNRNKLP